MTELLGFVILYSTVNFVEQQVDTKEQKMEVLPPIGTLPSGFLESER